MSAARRLQIRGPTNIQSGFDDSLGGQAADLIHPPTAPPVVEACLLIAPPMVGIGAHDRFSRARRRG